MTPSIRLFLLGVLLTLAGVEGVWLLVAHFEVDFIALRNVLVFALIPFSAGLFYTFVRFDQRVSAMLFGIAFLSVFGPLCTILTYFAVSIAGHRIDDFLAHIDQNMGVDWPSLVQFVCYHPMLINMLAVAYSASAFQVAIAIALLGLNGDLKDISRLCVATVLCALATIAFWTLLPSFGAYTVYDLASVAHKTHVIIDTRYPKLLGSVLAHGPGRVDPTNTRGLVGFPSFHAQEIVLAVWFLRKQPIFFVPILIFGIVALASVPIEGGHHVIDVVGGFGFAAVGILGAYRLVDRLTAFDRAQRRLSPKAATGVA